MALTFYWRCESGTLDGTHDYTAGDGTATDVNSPSYSTTARLVGTAGNGLLIDADERVTFDAASIVSAAAGAIGFWVRTTSQTADPQLCFEVDGASGERLIAVGTTGSIESNTANVHTRINRGHASDFSYATDSGNIALNTTYFYLVAWDAANNDLFVGVYNTGLTAVDTAEDTSSAFPDFWATPSLIKIGNSTGWRGYIDNVFIANAYADKDTILTKALIETYQSYAGGSTPKSRRMLLMGVG